MGWEWKPKRCSRTTLGPSPTNNGPPGEAPGVGVGLGLDVGVGLGPDVGPGLGLGSTTVVEPVAVSLPQPDSGSFAATPAVVLSEPVAVGLTTTFTSVSPPPARSPRWKVRTPSIGTTPPVAWTNATPGGRLSVSVTPVAPAAPPLLTVMV